MLLAIKTTNADRYCNVEMSEITKNMSVYEHIHMLDEEYIKKIAIELAVKKLFGDDFSFLRSNHQTTRIIGTIKGKSLVLRAQVFFEKET